MAGYTSRWDCRICDAAQDTDGVPKHHVCESCIEPLAEQLCQANLKASLWADGIDTRYWMNEAENYVRLLMQRWK